MQVHIQTVEHKYQRYPTTGDWYYQDSPNGEVLHIVVSKMSDWRYEMLVAFHELAEALICRYRGVSEAQVTEFDEAYESARRGRCIAPCGCEVTETSEPGDDFHAPYYAAHVVATNVERALAVPLFVNWKEYEQANLDLYKEDA